MLSQILLDSSRILIKFRLRLKQSSWLNFSSSLEQQFDKINLDDNSIICLDEEGAQKKKKQITNVDYAPQLPANSILIQILALYSCVCIMTGESNLDANYAPIFEIIELSVFAHKHQKEEIQEIGDNDIIFKVVERFIQFLLMKFELINNWDLIVQFHNQNKYRIFQILEIYVKENFNFLIRGISSNTFQMQIMPWNLQQPNNRYTHHHDKSFQCDKRAANQIEHVNSYILSLIKIVCKYCEKQIKQMEFKNHYRLCEDFILYDHLMDHFKDVDENDYQKCHFCQQIPFKPRIVANQLICNFCLFQNSMDRIPYELPINKQFYQILCKYCNGMVNITDAFNHYKKCCSNKFENFTKERQILLENQYKDKCFSKYCRAIQTSYESSTYTCEQICKCFLDHRYFLKKKIHLQNEIYQLIIKQKQINI